MKSSAKLALALTLVWICSAGTAPAQELVVNGDFETTDFTGWTQVDTGSGSFYVLTGTTTPDSGSTVLPAPDGLYAAVSDQGGPGSHILYQDIAIPDGVSALFSAIVYVENHAGAYFDAGNLSEVGLPNQQVRVDIMDPTAPTDDVTTGVLMNIFRTDPGDPVSIGYTTVTADLSAYAGSTVRIRIAEVDNQLFLNAAIDAVSVLVPQVPALPAWALALLWVGLLAGGVLISRLVGQRV